MESSPWRTGRPFIRATWKCGACGCAKNKTSNPLVQALRRGLVCSFGYFSPCSWRRVVTASSRRRRTAPRASPWASRRGGGKAGSTGKAGGGKGFPKGKGKSVGGGRRWPRVPPGTFQGAPLTVGPLGGVVPPPPRATAPSPLSLEELEASVKLHERARNTTEAHRKQVPDRSTPLPVQPDVPLEEQMARRQ